MSAKRSKNNYKSEREDMKPISMKKVRRYYANLGFAITRSKGYFCAERKENNIFIQSDRIDLLCQTLNRIV